MKQKNNESIPLFPSPHTHKRFSIKNKLLFIFSIETLSASSEVQAGSEEMLKGGESVAQEIQKLDSLTRIIADSMNEMASGAVQINNAMQDVNEITQKNKYSIENLAAEIGKFKV